MCPKAPFSLLTLRLACLALVPLQALAQPALENLVDEHQLAGMSVVTRCGDALSLESYGGFRDIPSKLPVNAATNYRIASISKAVVALAAAKLDEQGTLDLDAPIGDVFEDPPFHPDHPETPLTLRHLLTHTSGIRDGDGYGTFLSDTYSAIPDVPSLSSVLGEGGAYYTANMWGTQVYTKESMRGGISELTNKNQNQGEGGLSFDYAMAWSSGVYESVALVIPNAAGGGMMVDYSDMGTKTYDQLVRAFRQQGMNASQAEAQANQYMGAAFMKWTGESMGNGAYYVGAGVFFLFCLALFTVGGTMRNWVLASGIFFLFMAWGSNFESFNKLLFDTLPLYNKFRVPSMAMVVLFFLIPFYGIYGLNSWIGLDKAARMKAFTRGAAAFAGFVVLFGLIAPYAMNLEGARDASFTQQGFSLDQLISDRQGIITSSAMRSLIFGLLTAAALYVWHIGKLNQVAAIAAVGAITLLDLYGFDRDQLELDDFQSKRQWEQQYAPNAANQAILQDKDPHFRVWNSMAGLTNDSYTSYHHKSIGGYHGAKLQRYQDLIDNQLNKQNMACFSMLNAKYVIAQGANGQPQAQRNPNACGNAWSVNNVNVVANADAEMAALSSFNPKTTAVVDARYSDYLGNTASFAPAKVKLASYDPKYMEYSFEGGNAFVVFSEIYYEGSGNDWQAYIDGEPVEHIRVNYTLRGMKVPAGRHEIVFEFKPKSFYAGQKVNMAGSGLLLLLIAYFGWSAYKENKA